MGFGACHIVGRTQVGDCTVKKESEVDAVKILCSPIK